MVCDCNEWDLFTSVCTSSWSGLVQYSWNLKNEVTVCDCTEWDLFTSVCTLCSRLVVEVDCSRNKNNEVMVCDCNEWDLFTSVCTLCSRLVVEVDWYDTVEIKTMK